MPQSAKFWDRIALRYSKRPVADEDAYRKKLEVTQGYLEPHMEVLEIGCGTGSTALAHAEHVQHIMAIDLSPKMLEIAMTRAKVSDTGNVTFRASSIDAFEADPESYDVVLGLSILHLLDNWRDVVRKVHELLKPGGIFVTSTACIGDMSPVYKFILPIGGFLRLIPQVEIFTAAELKAGITAAGFEVDYDWRPAPDKAQFFVAKKVSE